MAKLSASTLRRILGEVESYGLSKSKTESIRVLAEAELARRESNDRFAEFHHWIRMGDQILTDLQCELKLLQAVTSTTGALVSRESVMEILSTMCISTPCNEHEKGQNWCAQTAISQITKLPMVQSGVPQDTTPIDRL